MKKFLLLFVFLGFFTCSPVSAYQINNFDSQIDIQKNTNLRVTERIKAFFDTPKHGIIRTIPVIYRTKTKNVNSRISDIAVTDETGNKYQFTASRTGDDLDIKIGDPDETIRAVNSVYAKRRLQYAFCGRSLGDIQYLCLNPWPMQVN